jgi:drug/metabolite transporter (DMT)-like permease
LGMIELVNRDKPNDLRTRRLRWLKKLAVFCLEIAAEAVGTCMIIVVLAFAEFRHEAPPLHNDLSVSKIVGVSLFILIEFALTGYLATTLISRFSLRGRLLRWYPYVCAALFMIHSTIFFVLVGNRVFDQHNLSIQILGACFTLACAWTGNVLLARWR